MKLMKEPPLYSINGVTPKNIVGLDFDLYSRHFQAWVKNESDPGKIEKMFSNDELERIGNINKSLLDYGFRPRYISQGKVVFGIICSGNRRQIRPEIEPSVQASSPDHARDMIREIREKLDPLFVPF